MGEDRTPHTVKVVDRRRFTVDGGLREDEVCEESTAPDLAPDATADPPVDDPEPSAPRAQFRDAGVSDGEMQPQPSPEFVELVIMLARQAEILMVGTDEIPAQPDEARRLIDSLGALQTKTGGNLTPEEEKILSEVLFQLRTVFVQGPK